MNFINKILCITALFAIGSATARPVKGRGGAAATAPVPAPAQNKAPAPARNQPTQGQQPAGQASSYKQLHDRILGMSQANVFTGNQFQPKFIQDTMTQAQATDIGADGLKFLLQTARDKFAPFTGNNDSDLNLLIQINKQIDTESQKI